MKRIWASLDRHVKAFGAALLFGLLAYAFVHVLFWTGRLILP